MLSTWRRRLGFLAGLPLAAVVGVGLAASLYPAPEQEPNKPDVQPTSDVKQASDWLSESYWRRRSRQARAQRTYITPQVNPFGSEQSAAQGGRIAAWGGTYRTVCVRLCDGYYFPISFSTTRDRFRQDAKACASRCASPSRLYVYPVGTGSPDTMTDVSGRAYEKLKTAFLYRTTYDKSCRCRPDPWSDSEKQRHALYRTKSWQRKARRLARLEARKARRARRQFNRRRVRVAQPIQAPVNGLAAFTQAQQPSTFGTGIAGSPVAAPVRTGRNQFRRDRRMGLGVGNRAVRRARPVRRPSSTWKRTWKRNAFSSEN